MSSRQALGAMIPSLSDKFKSSDSDIRVMALIDLNKELTRVLTQATASKPARASENYTDETSEKVLTSLVLGLLSDSNAEVKNAAVACLANMSKRARPAYMRQILASITEGIGAPGQKVDEEGRDISCLALKSVVAEMSPESSDTASCLTTVLARIRQNVCVTDANPQLASELLQILTDIYPRFDLAISESAQLQTDSVTIFREVLSVPRLSVRKRAVPALAAFITICPSHFNSLKPDLVKGLAAGGDSGKGWVAAVTGMAKTTAHSDVGELISSGGLVNSILKQASNLDDSDAVEGALTALETLALRCSGELAPFVDTIVARALELVKYDPNYVDLDDDDDDVDMADDDDDDDEFDDDGYSDDDDDSWKIRRSAAKLLHALISTRVDLLAEFYRTAAPQLMARFKEREESVRLEVLAAFEALLKQTANARAAEIAASGRNKRKRGGDDMDHDADEDSSVSSLLDMRPQLVKEILKQASAKSVITRQQSFTLLRQVIEALDGGLDAEADAICETAKGALRTSDSTTPSLTIAVLALLTSFFHHQSARSYVSHLAGLTPDIVRCMRDKLQRVSFEGFACASALAQAIRPTKGSASPLRSGYDRPIKEMFAATCSVLGDSSVDSDVRERALVTLGDILVHEGDAVHDQLDTALGLITARLASETTASIAIEVIGRVAESTLCSGTAFDAWLLEVLSAVVVSVRRNKRSVSKANEFDTINSILRRLGASLPETIATGIVAELKPFVDSPAALETLSIVLQSQPASREAVTKQILPEVYNVVTKSSSTVLITALTEFFGTYVDGDAGCAVKIVPALVANVGKNDAIPDATLGGTLAYSTTARCIGVIVQHSPSSVSKILTVFQRNLASGSEPDVYLALLSIGEIGRIGNLGANPDLFQSVLGFLGHTSEEVRSAAAFAAGNMAVGGSEEFLPILIGRLEAAKDESGRLLLLYALKEVILHSSDAQLEQLTDTLWQPLFGDKGATASSDDGIRNVKAACIGKLTVATPARFLPQLQEMLKGTSQQRALVAAAIRYAFIDSTKADSATRTDELIAPIVGDFLSLMKDDDVVVRRLAVAALNAAAQSRPHIIVDKLPLLQPYLYKETEVKKELQREVQMGPWKVIEDDGLENRKTAYETMYTLVATCFSKLDLPAFTERVLAALADVNEIKILGLMLLLRLAQLAPAHVIPRLDEVAQSLKTIMKDLEVKEDTIKQDLERKEEMQRSTLRTAVPLYRMSTAAQAPAFHAFVASLLKTDQWKEYHDYQA